MYELIGWVGSLLLAFCALPQAIKSYREKCVHGVSALFLWSWFAGEVFTLIYMIPPRIWPAIANLSLNLMFLCVVLFYRYFPSKEALIYVENSRCKK